MIKIGDKIALLREKRVLTQEELAGKLNLSRASLCHYEKNRREPDYDIILRIADFFSVSVDYLMGRTGDPHSVLDPQVRHFVDSLELSDEELQQRFDLTVDGRSLTAEEARRFIAFVRAERALSQTYAPDAVAAAK